MKKILIIGGTGLIGNNIAEVLHGSGYQISILSRHPSVTSKYTVHTWNPMNGDIPVEVLREQNILINLGGASIGGGLWTNKRRQSIVTSRVLSTRLLISTIIEHKLSPELFINASAIGFYGNRPEEKLTEASNQGSGFLSQVCAAWENELRPLIGLKIPTAVLRFGMVLSNSDGIFTKLMLPLRYGISIRFGSGTQYYSWIHLHDLTKCVLALIRGELMTGFYNCSSPTPVRQIDFNRMAQTVTGKKLFRISLPEKLLLLVMGEFSTLLTNDSYVIPSRLLAQKFEFLYPSLDLALQQLLSVRK